LQYRYTKLSQNDPARVLKDAVFQIVRFVLNLLVGVRQRELKIPLSGSAAAAGESVLSLYHLLQADPTAAGSVPAKPAAAAAAAFAEREASGALGFSDMSQFERHRCAAPNPAFRPVDDLISSLSCALCRQVLRRPAQPIRAQACCHLGCRAARVRVLRAGRALGRVTRFVGWEQADHPAPTGSRQAASLPPAC
jgi:hypothetical protein